MSTLLCGWPNSKDFRRVELCSCEIVMYDLLTKTNVWLFQSKRLGICNIHTIQTLYITKFIDLQVMITKVHSWRKGILKEVDGCICIIIWSKNTYKHNEKYEVKQRTIRRSPRTDAGIRATDKRRKQARRQNCESFRLQKKKNTTTWYSKTI